MAEKIVSPGVYTNEIDQSFLPAALGPIGSAIVGPTVKGPVLTPTVVSSYSEYVQIFGEVISSGSNSYQYLTSHTAKEYLKQGGPCTIVRVGEPNLSKASASLDGRGGDHLSTSPFSLEALGDGTQFNSSGSIVAETNLIQPVRHIPGNGADKNDHFNSGSRGGRADNFRYEVSSINDKKGTFTLLIRQGNDVEKSKVIIETHANLTLDPNSPDYVTKRIGNRTQTVAVEASVAYLADSGDYPNKSKYVRVVGDVAEAHRTPNYLDDDGNVNLSDAGASYSGSLPKVGSGSEGGSFNGGHFGNEVSHPFKMYDAITATNSQGVKLGADSDGNSNYSVQVSAVGGGYATAISMLSNKDEYDFNLLFMPGIIDQIGVGHNGLIQKAIQMCEDRGDAFFVYDNVSKTTSVADAKTNTEARNSSYAATYYPWVQIQDASLGTYRYVPPSVVMAGVYHFNDTIGQPWFAPAGLNRGGIDSAVQAYKKLSQSQRDDLYDSNVNPIATFPGQGVTAFGQKTTQKKASALDRINVRRLLIDVKKFVSRSSKTLVFEQNTTDLRNQFVNTVNPFLETVQANSGLNAFRVVMDDTNNTPETIDRNMLVGQIFLQPTKTAEFIVLDFVVQPTGAEFPE